MPASFDSNRPRVPGATAALLVVIAVWLISLSNLLVPWDDLIYDQVIQALPEKNTAEHAVALVETGVETQTIPARLVQTLLTGGAKHVVVLLPIDAADPLTPAAASQVTRTRPLARETPPDVALALGRDEFPAILAANPSGMFREQLTTTTLGGQTYATLEGQVARQLGHTNLSTVYRVNFHQGRHIPQLAASKVNNAKSVELIVRDKVVLIGPGSGPFSAELPVPGSSTERLITRAEFHAQALDTLLQNKAVLTVAPLLRLPLLALLAAVLVLSFQPMQLRHGIATAIATVFVVLLASAALLRLTDLWLPAQSLIFVVIGVFIVVYREKTKDESRRISALLSKMEARLHVRVMPKSFNESQEYWSHVINLVDQTLHLSRSIFLERVAEGHRVKEIAAMNCSIEAIDEMRRDYERVPFTLAIEARGTIALPTNRLFLRTENTAERQYLSPFILEGEVLGFWVMGIHAEKIGNEEEFIASVNAMAEQVAILLYQRKLWIAQQQREDHTFTRYVQDDTTERLNALKQAVAALDRRTQSLENLFTGISTAAILYDLFGRVILVNQRMTELLSSNDQRPFENTAQDLITTLTGLPRDEVRDILARMLQQAETTQFQIAIPKPTPTTYLLNVRPLNAEAEDESSGQQPFNLYGILIELIDVGELNHGFQLKLNLVDFVSQGITDEMAALEAAVNADCRASNPLNTRIVSQPPAPLAACNGATGLRKRIDKISDRLVELRHLLDQPVGVGHANLFPIVPEEVINQAREKVGDDIHHKHLTWNIQPCNAKILCHTNPADLSKLLAACCERLVDDAVSNSAIQVSLTLDADGEGVVITLSNHGFGMPEERLTSILGDEALGQGTPWDALRTAAIRCRHWNTTFSAKAELGSGLQFTIRLPRFR